MIFIKEFSVIIRKNILSGILYRVFPQCTCTTTTKLNPIRTISRRDKKTVICPFSSNITVIFLLLYLNCPDKCLPNRACIFLYCGENRCYHSFNIRLKNNDETDKDNNKFSPCLFHVSKAL